MLKNIANPTLNQNTLYKKKVLLLILIISVIRLIIAFTVELGNDESYYWFYSQHLKTNYFDHPPMVALWVRIFTLNLLLQNFPGFIRLGSVAGCALSTWFMYKCVAQLCSEKAGWFAACLYNASFYAGITAGIFIMPDSPQMVFWTLSMWMIAKLCADDTKLISWILVGISIGLCVMSKVHGVFIWIGIGLFVLFYKRTWFAKPYLYLAVAISILISLPILFWNIKYNFVTYSFDSARIKVGGFNVNWHSFFSQAFEQIVINNPINFILIVLALFTWRKHQLKKIPALKIYNLIGLTLALLLLYISLYRDDTLPHWSGPAYVTLIPLAAIRLNEMKELNRLPKSVIAALFLHVLFLIVCTLFVLYYPGDYGKVKPPFRGLTDLTIDNYGWKEAGKQFDSLYADEVTKKIMPASSPVVCYKWWGAHVEYYFCRPSKIKMIGLDGMINLHEYMWMNTLRKDKVDFSKAYCIVPSDEFYSAKVMYAKFYAQINFIKTISVSRSNKPAVDFYIYRLSGWKNNLPSIK
jgi:4-amino-4-deoxy-L-arabinose transferase-like glycosyltransferase